MGRVKFLFALILICFSVINSNATWSIIVVDPATKLIGIAGASCTYSVYGIGAIVPGKGAIVVQAMSNPLARLKGIRMIMADATPKEIMDALKDPEFDPEEQQYAVICVSDLNHPQTYTGAETPFAKGALTGDGVCVQGNTLVSAEELQAVLDAVKKAQKQSLSLEDILMLGLEAGAKSGGDKRCGDTKASSAFLTVMKPNDDRKKPYLNLVVYGDAEGRNAVEALRIKLEKWKVETK